MTTKGKSQLGTSKRTERDALVQSWEPRSALASIGYYMETQGKKVRHMSDIVHFCVETVQALVLKSNSPFIDTAQATSYLEDRTGVNLNPNNRGNKNLVSNLLLESGASVDDIIPVPPTPPKTTETIELLKERAKEQFLSRSDLVMDREEKDSKKAEEEKAALDLISKFGKGE